MLPQNLNRKNSQENDDLICPCSLISNKPRNDVIFGRLLDPMSMIVYNKRIKSTLLGFSENIPLSVIIQSKARSNKVKLMNYCIDIHYTPSDCQEGQGQSFVQRGSEKNRLPRKQQNSKKIKGKKSNFVWTVKEQRSYVSFLKSERELFRLSPKERKIVKINLQMSDRVKTRTGPQCHSHHQKMMKKYKTIEAIISGSTHLFYREKREELKEDGEETPSEHEMAEKPIEQQHPVEASQQEADTKRPIWWQYLNLMDSPSDELEFHDYSFESNASF